MNEEKIINSPDIAAFKNCNGLYNCYGKATSSTNINIFEINQINKNIEKSDCLTEKQKKEFITLLNDFEKTKKCSKLKNFLKGLSSIALNFSVNLISAYVGKIYLGL